MRLRAVPACGACVRTCVRLVTRGTQHRQISVENDRCDTIPHGDDGSTWRGLQQPCRVPSDDPRSLARQAARKQMERIKYKNLQVIPTSYPQDRPGRGVQRHPRPCYWPCPLCPKKPDPQRLVGTVVASLRLDDKAVARRTALSGKLFSPWLTNSHPGLQTRQGSQSPLLMCRAAQLRRPRATWQPPTKTILIRSQDEGRGPAQLRTSAPDCGGPVLGSFGPSLVLFVGEDPLGPGEPVSPCTEATISSSAGAQSKARQQEVWRVFHSPEALASRDALILARVPGGSEASLLPSSCRFPRTAARVSSPSLQGSD